MDKLLYVESKILEEDYSLLSDDIAIGPVYKINGSFSIENDGYDISYLYIPTGSGIRLHNLDEGAERYKSLKGTFKIDGRETDESICFNSTPSHGVDVTSSKVILEVCSVSHDYLKNIKTSLTSQFFDELSDGRGYCLTKKR